MNVLVLCSLLPILSFSDCSTNCNGTSSADDNHFLGTIEFPKMYIERNILSNRRTPTNIVDQVNIWADVFLAHVNTLVKSYDLESLRLPNINKKLKWGLVEGKVNLKNGMATKWATFNRAARIELKQNKKMKYYAVVLPFKIDFVKVNYKFNANIMKVGPKGTVVTLIKNIKYRLIARFSTATYRLKIDSFRIYKVGNIEVSVTEGSQSLTWFVTLLTRTIQNEAKEIISNKISNLIEGILKAITKQVNELIRYFKNLKFHF